MARLQRSLSIANLRRGRRGQIATFLLLIIGAVLIFTLVTANLGQTVKVATALDNVVDSSALLLGSQLATKSHNMWLAFGQKEQKCKSLGWLGTILSIIFAVIAVVATCWSGCWGVPATMAIAAAAGASGGAIGGGIEGGWEGALYGGIQGAITGAAIGLGAGTGAEMGGTLGGSWMGFPGAFVPSATGAMIGGIAGGSLAVGSSIFNKVVQDQMASDAISAAAKSLNGLPETEQLRESVFLHAFSQAVDDPNQTDGTCHWPDAWPALNDPNDANGNSIATEQIPCFLFWWDERIRQLKSGIPPLRCPVEGFLNGPLAHFEIAAERTFSCGDCPATCEAAGCTRDCVWGPSPGCPHGRPICLTPSCS